MGDLLRSVRPVRPLLRCTQAAVAPEALHIQYRRSCKPLVPKRSPGNHMDDPTTTHAAANPVSTFDLGAWIGRGQAFSFVANHCSAAQAECLTRSRAAELPLAGEPVPNAVLGS
jgi:hypothetical protein